jgi:hypothetical protein
VLALLLAVLLRRWHSSEATARHSMTDCKHARTSHQAVPGLTGLAMWMKRCRDRWLANSRNGVRCCKALRVTMLMSAVCLLRAVAELR